MSLFDLSLAQWVTYGVATLMVGFSKTSAPGLGTVVVPLLAAEFPARLSTGVLLTVLASADVVAVAYYRRSAKWPLLVRLLPWTVVGVIGGFLLLGRIDDQQLECLIAAIVLLLLIVGVAREVAARRSHGDVDDPAPTGWWFAAIMGILAGVTTMVSNAAGPIITIYLLAMGLPKREFLGTGAWFYLIVNLIKVPFSTSLGLISGTSLLMNVGALPLIIGGGLLGIVVVRRLPERAFGITMRILALAGAIRLAF